MKKLLAIFGAILFGCWSSASAQTFPPGEFPPASPPPEEDLLSHLLESQICETIPSLPSCAAFSHTLPRDPDSKPIESISSDRRFMTLVLDYLATTQMFNKNLREQETAQAAKIATLEQTKVQLEGQVRALEREWLPTVDKDSGTPRRSDVDVAAYYSSSPRVSTSDKYYQPTANILRPTDCSDYLVLGEQMSGVYDIYPFKCRCSEPVKVWCDMETDGGGWTVILKRQNSSDLFNFSQPWSAYKKGFGNASTEYWIGNDNLHVMTNTRPYNLRIDFEETNGGIRWAEWAKFNVDSEANKYKLTVTSFNPLSMTSDCMTYHNTRAFSTFDYDNDGNGGNCALSHKGGFWYHSCMTIAPTDLINSSGQLTAYCNYVVGGKNVNIVASALQVKMRPEICNQLIKSVHFNSHTCEGHNGF